MTQPIPWWPLPDCDYESSVPGSGICLHDANPDRKCTPWACPLNHTHRLPLKADMVAARRDPEVRKDVTRRVIACTNSTVDGGRWAPRYFACLDFDRAWVDPACFGAGPCLKVPFKDPCGVMDDTVHRVRPIYEPGDLLLFGEALDRGPAFDTCRRGLARYSHDHDLVQMEEAAATLRGWSTYGNHWLEWPWQRATQPAVFCPKELVRDQAVVISAGPVRLQDMTQEEALREGVSQKLATEWGIATSPSFEEFARCEARRVFWLIWDEINGARCPWKDNRFVWRIEATKWGALKEVFGEH